MSPARSAPQHATRFPLAFGLALGALLGALAGAAWRGSPRAQPSSELAARAEVSRLAGRAEALETELAEARRAPEQREAQLRERIRSLEAQLARVEEARVERERSFLEHTRILQNLAPGGLPPEVLFPALAEKQEPEPEIALLEEERPNPDPLPPLPPRSERDREIFRSLRALFLLEGLEGLELLEGGRLGEGWTGPVVLRSRDERGRYAGTIVAERMRLEASRAGRMLTLVLEEGYERHGERRAPFTGAAEGATRGGVRRIVLQGVDPGPWIDAVPELFREEDRVPAPDDGVFDRYRVLIALNELLAFEKVGGVWRVRSIGGIADAVLHDVELDQLGEDGGTRRRLLADRMEIRAAERGVRLELRAGVQLVGGRRLPFLEDRYRIFLPAADAEAWRRAGIPGLVSAPPADTLPE